jgi:hypothetical protein
LPQDGGRGIDLAFALRAIVLAILVLALVLPSVWRERGRDSPGVFWVNDGAARADELLGAAPPALIAREASDPPTAAELDVLAGAAERAPLYAGLPRGVRLIEASATPHPLAGRAAAVSFRLRGRPGDQARVYLSEAGGVVDSVRVRLDGAGVAEGAFRVRPAVPGWREWSVRAAWAGGARDADASATLAGAWVDSAGPPRVLVRAGFPDWESKFVVRALEESGARVQTSLALGRGLAVEQGGGAISPARLAAFDAVVVLDGAPLGDGDRAALVDFAARGGGVLLAGAHAAAPGFGLAAAGREAVVSGTAIRWSLPPELAPLPADRVSSAGAPLAGVAAGATVGAAASQGAVLVLRPLGRGRAAGLALSETWRWRMEAGRVAEHRELWRGLVDWLSSAPRGPLTIDLPEPSGPPGVRREVRVFDARGEAGGPVPPLVATRPGGRADTLALARDPAAPGVLRAWFLPGPQGLYAFALAGRAPSAAFRASPTSSDADAWARLSLLAARSGGRALPADSLRPTVERLAAGLPRGDRRGVSPWLLFALLLAAAGAEWAIRRLSGRA